MGLLKHVFFLFVLAAFCYVVAITITTSEVAFIVFLVLGLLSELVFWILFWRQRKESRSARIGTQA